MEVWFDWLMEQTEKCTRQSVLSVERNAKFPSNQMEADQFTAGSAILNEDPREGFKLISWNPRSFLHPFPFFVNNKQS